MTESPLASARRLLAQTAAALHAAAGAGASEDELLSVLALCESSARRLDGVVVDVVAALQRRDTFAERGYRSPADALSDVVGWERFEARRRAPRWSRR